MSDTGMHAAYKAKGVDLERQLLRHEDRLFGSAIGNSRVRLNMVQSSNIEAFLIASARGSLQPGIYYYSTYDAWRSWPKVGRRAVPPSSHETQTYTNHD